MKERFISYQLATKLKDLLFIFHNYSLSSKHQYSFHSRYIYVYVQQDLFFSSRQGKDRSACLTMTVEEYFDSHTIDRDNCQIYSKYNLEELLDQYRYFHFDFFCKKHGIQVKVCETNGLKRTFKEIKDVLTLKDTDYVVVTYCDQEIEFCEDDQETLVCSLGYAMIYIGNIIAKKENLSSFGYIVEEYNIHSLE